MECGKGDRMRGWKGELEGKMAGGVEWKARKAGCRDIGE